MKQALYILLIGFALLSSTSCKEEMPDKFQDISGVYLNNRLSNNTLVDSTNVTFVYTEGDTMKVPVKIQLIGRPARQNRPVNLTVTSDNAVEGTDYALPTSAVLPADSSAYVYNITLKRTPELKKQKKSLQITLAANDYFSLPVTHEEQPSGEDVTTLHYTIYFSDMFTTRPASWIDEEWCGVFTQQRFELICRVLSINPADFNDSSKMTLSMYAYIRTQMREYVKEETEKMNAGKDYDHDIIDETTGKPLEF